MYIRTRIFNRLSGLHTKHTSPTNVSGHIMFVLDSQCCPNQQRTACYPSKWVLLLAVRVRCPVPCALGSLQFFAHAPGTFTNTLELLNIAGYWLHTPPANFKLPILIYTPHAFLPHGVVVVKLRAGCMGLPRTSEVLLSCNFAGGTRDCSAEDGRGANANGLGISGS